jgi:hypothetical protein
LIIFQGLEGRRRGMDSKRGRGEGEREGERERERTISERIEAKAEGSQWNRMICHLFVLGRVAISRG